MASFALAHYSEHGDVTVRTERVWRPIIFNLDSVPNIFPQSEMDDSKPRLALTPNIYMEIGDFYCKESWNEINENVVVVPSSAWTEMYVTDWDGDDRRLVAMHWEMVLRIFHGGYDRKNSIYFRYGADPIHIDTPVIELWDHLCFLGGVTADGRKRQKLEVYTFMSDEEGEEAE